MTSVKAPVNNQISDVNYSIVSHRPQCRWAAHLSSDQSETSAELSSGRSLLSQCTGGDRTDEETAGHGDHR